MKPLQEYLNEHIINEAFQALCTTTSDSTNAPFDYEGVDRCDLSVSDFLTEILDKESDLDIKEIAKYKAFLEQKGEILDNLFAIYPDTKLGKKTKITVMIAWHKDGDNSSYYVMAENQFIVELLDWLKQNLSKCVSFARKNTIWRG